MKSIIINIDFDFYSDSNGKDPDYASPTLKTYHQKLWSKKLPNGKIFDLESGRKNTYLYHYSELGEFYLGSDAITHSYKTHTRKKWLTNQIPDHVNQLYSKGSTIGGYLIFPNNRINGKHTINQARGVNAKIDDRFDLTLECIKRFYNGISSPLYETLGRYEYYFKLFEDFENFTDYFLLNDLIDEKKEIKFYLPFDEFQSKPKFHDISDYLFYKNSVIEFINKRNHRIKLFSVE